MRVAPAMIEVPRVIAQSFPIGDWQFWAATAVFLFAGFWLVRGLLPQKFLRRKRRGARHKARLTIEGRVAPKPSDER